VTRRRDGALVTPLAEAVSATYRVAIAARSQAGDLRERAGDSRRALDATHVAVERSRGLVAPRSRRRDPDDEARSGR
jgi:hypothetical protein